MFAFRLFCGLSLCLISNLSGCGSSARDLPLDLEVAHVSLDKAMQAWVAGQKPVDLKPEIVVGDSAWDSGKTLVSYEILTAEERSDGTNLHVPVKRKFNTQGKETESRVVYIVGTSPVITIFPE